MMPGLWMVTGARGMLGRDLTDALAEAGVKAVGLGSGDIDIRSANSVRDALNDLRPALVINAAAFTNVDGAESQQEEAFAVNALGPENLALACKEIRAKLVHISTDYVFDGSKTTAYDVDDPLAPLGAYGRSKAAGEEAVRKLLPDGHCVVRTQWLFGLNGKNFVETMLALAQTNPELRVVNDQHGSPTYTHDLARALVKLCQRDCLGTYHVTNSGETTWFHFARLILDLAGMGHVSTLPVSTSEFPRPAPRPGHAVLSNARFIKDVGMSLRPWQEALADYMRLRS